MPPSNHDLWCSYLSEIINTLKSTNQHEEVLHLVVDRLVRLSHCQTCAVVLIDPKTEYLCIDNCHGLSLTFCNAFRRRLATASIGELLWTGKPIIISDNVAQPVLAEEVKLENEFASCLCIQIVVDHRTLGYLHLDSREKEFFSSHDIARIQPFADLAGLALVKSHLFEENLRLETIDRESGLEKYGPFLEKMQASVAHAGEAREHVAVMILDIDNFKDALNTYGYDASRQLLKEMGGIVKSRLRDADAAARYGFDEFILLMADADLDRGVESARGLLEAIAESSFTKHGFKSTVSIGIAAFPQNGTDTEDLILNAKHALFEAQRGGRNTVFSFPSAWYETHPVEPQAQ